MQYTHHIENGPILLLSVSSRIKKNPSKNIIIENIVFSQFSAIINKSYKIYKNVKLSAEEIFFGERPTNQQAHSENTVTYWIGAKNVKIFNISQYDFLQCKS